MVLGLGSMWSLAAMMPCPVAEAIAHHLEEPQTRLVSESSVQRPHAVPNATSGGGWEFAGWDGGGMYPGLVPDPQVDGRLFLLSDVAGLWRSDDRGARWQFHNDGLTSLNLAVLAIAPSNSQILYVGAPAGVMRSADAGMTWTALPSLQGRLRFEKPNSYRSLVVSPQHPDTVYAGTKNGDVYRTTDAGQHWAPIGATLQPFGMSVHITAMHVNATDARLFVGSSRGLMRADLTTGTWTMLHDVPVSDMVGYGNPETICVTSRTAIGCSQDAGTTWTFSQPIPRGEITRLAAASMPGHGTRWLIGWKDGWKGGVARSDDEGRSWTSVDGHVDYDVAHNPTRAWMTGLQRPNAVQIDPHDPAIFYYTDSWGVLRSDDAGGQWHEIIAGAPNTSGSDLHIADDGTIFVAAMDQGLVQSTDGGMTYHAVCPTPESVNTIAGDVWRIMTLPKAQGSNEALKFVATHSPWHGAANDVLVGTAGQACRLTQGLPAARPKKNTFWGTGYPRALAIDPSDPQRLYLGVDGDDGGGLFISSNGGEQWERAVSQPPSTKIYNGLAVDPTNPHRLFWGGCGKGGGVSRSSDGGAHWDQVFSAMPCVFDLAIARDGTIYAAGTQPAPALYTSTDHGDSWTLLRQFASGASAEAIGLDPKNPTTLFVGVVQWGDKPGGQVWYSPDRGATWREVTAGLPPNSGPAAIAIHPMNRMVYVLLYAGSVYRRGLSDLEPQS